MSSWIWRFTEMFYLGWIAVYSKNAFSLTFDLTRSCSWLSFWMGNLNDYLAFMNSSISHYLLTSCRFLGWFVIEEKWLIACTWKLGSLLALFIDSSLNIMCHWENSLCDSRCYTDTFLAEMKGAEQINWSYLFNLRLMGSQRCRAMNCTKGLQGPSLVGFHSVAFLYHVITKLPSRFSFLTVHENFVKRMP